ncbi:Two-component sensor histidine kinase, contains HisKA and HATPase domains [Hathewaya proteolytica DSM 3090]|uniref:histidine kinase n=1 Tax=Hathewaya proteolytica DSM 3090 TaxID=1121331 RepID=A0A1M6KBD6_9CLOT|nr:histidine kinase N-terminal domain-containing protein [Hathewaya proteolytica]SHJ56286.1 Two-component sensor histidine kinase, contains HisKA and HATPase domains [Hathewaya proteolytica DSM 3090]
MDTTKELLKKYSNLDEQSILKIQEVCNSLKFIANIVQADVFIDCPTRDKDIAIVINEAKPDMAPSLYKENVVGKFALRENEPAVFRSLDLGVSTRDIKALTQENVNVTQTVEPILNHEGRTIGVIIIERDLTGDIGSYKKMKVLEIENIQLSNELEQFKNDTEHITYHIDDSIIIFDADGLVRFKNPSAEQLYMSLGYKENLIGMHFDNIVLGNKKFSQICQFNDTYIEEIEVGDSVFEVRYIKQVNKVLYLEMLIKNITYIKEKEKELIYKSVAIKEIHHRVKNNLQTIASLLRLQSRRVKDEAVKPILEDSINRILAIASSHEILAQSGIDEVSIMNVLERMMRGIKSGYVLEDKNINIDISGDDFNLNSDKATNISLIVNELVQNSFKYAFKGKNEGNINIIIKEGKTYSSISIIDDGIGFDMNKVNSKSLGLSIVKSLVKDKLKGEIKIDSSQEGTKITFDFANKI